MLSQFSASSSHVTSLYVTFRHVTSGLGTGSGDDRRGPFSTPTTHPPCAIKSPAVAAAWPPGLAGELLLCFASSLISHHAAVACTSKASSTASQPTCGARATPRCTARPPRRPPELLRWFSSSKPAPLHQAAGATLSMSDDGHMQCSPMNVLKAIIGITE